MDNKSIIKEIETLVESACKKSTNHFGYSIWTHHILLVVKYSKLMAKKIGADEEVVEIASLLHDYAGISDYSLQDDHHIHGAKFAEEILSRYDYPKNKIELIKECILSHRGSKPKPKLTKESICVSDADAMAHFDSIPSLFYLNFLNNKMDIDEAESWLIDKLEKDWEKLSPEAKEIIKDKYEASKILFKE